MLMRRWNEATARERLLIVVMAVMVLGALIFAVLLRPAWRLIQRAPQTLTALDATVLRMRAQAADLRAKPAVLSSAGAVSATPFAERELKTPGATVTVVPAGSSTAQGVTTINLTSVEGVKLAAWLASPMVQRQLQSLTLTRDPLTGRVAGSVMLRSQP